MPRTVRPLSDAAVRATKPRPKPFRLFDGLGLYIEVHPSGAKLWRMKYRFAGKEKRLAFGAWPEVSLAQARARRADARRVLAEGIDPGQARHRAAPRFEAVAREWIGRHLPPRPKSIAYRSRGDTNATCCPSSATGRWTRSLRSMCSKSSAASRRGPLETAHRALQNIGQVLRYAVATGRAKQDVTAFLRGALPPAPVRHMPAPATDPDRVGEILRALEGFRGGHVVATALMLLPYLFVRPGELRIIRWEEVDLEAGLWRFTAAKTKTDHIVPLSR